MKRLLFLLAILLAIGASLAIANESNGPPEAIAGQYTCPVDAVLSPVAVQVQKEFNAVGFDLVALSTSTGTDEGTEFPLLALGLAIVAEYPSVEPMLAGLMYGARLNGWMDNAAEAYVIPKVSDTRPSLGAVA